MALTQIPLDLLRSLNVPATDATSTILQRGSGTSTTAPSEGVAGRSGEIAPTPPVIFTPGNAQGAAQTAPTASAPLAAATVQNAVVLENQKPGNPRSEWDLSGAGSANIEGFAADISVNHGQTINFKINTNSNNYRVDIYRLGYYGGMGARKVATLQHQTPTATVQPGPIRDFSTGEVDAGNWSVTDFLGHTS